MKYPCTEERFLADVANHEMTVDRDDGVHRFIRFRKPGTRAYYFDLLTWPGCLCISGDCGTYVFSRLNDMFEFFRGGRINPPYWGEKLLSIGTHEGYRKFDAEVFAERAKDHFDQYWEDRDDDEAKAECWAEIEDYVLGRVSNEYEAYSAIQEFDHDGFQFVDFFDGGGTESYTFHYIWCLRAIVWGIDQYDRRNGATEAAA